MSVLHLAPLRPPRAAVRRVANGPHPLPARAMLSAERRVDAPARTATDKVDLWLFRLNVDVNLVRDATRLLSAEEQARARRFYFDRHRHAFIAAHALLRTLLGAYLAADPRLLAFHVEPHGKPLLDGDSAIQFSLSHSDELLLIALTGCGPIGVDIERLSATADPSAWTNDVLSPAEAHALDHGDANDRYDRFLTIWTRKEAMLKATGDGLAHSLRQIDSSADSIHAAAIKEIPTLDGVAPVTVRSVAGPGYVAAVALSGRYASLPIAWGSY